MNEEWRIVPSYPMIEASSQGRLRYTDEYMKTVVGGGKRPAQTRPEKITGFGYVQTSIVPDRSTNKTITVTVHKLVCEAFHGQPENDRMKADHIDGDKINHIPANLRWLTNSENCNRAPNVGKRRWFYPGELWLMKRCMEHKISYAIIGKMFKCSAWVIHAVRRGQKETHVRALY